MKLLQLFIILLFGLGIAGLLTSCSITGDYVHARVEKSKLISEDETHAIYPSTAITPMINADKVNDKVTEIIINYSK